MGSVLLNGNEYIAANLGNHEASRRRNFNGKCLAEDASILKMYNKFLISTLIRADKVPFILSFEENLSLKKT